MSTVDLSKVSEILEMLNPDDDELEEIYNKALGAIEDSDAVMKLEEIIKNRYPELIGEISPEKAAEKLMGELEPSVLQNLMSKILSCPEAEEFINRLLMKKLLK